MEAVAGDYEFIFHQLNQKIFADQSTSGNNAEVELSQDITLKADGTVTGDISGTWTMKNGSPEMTLTYDGVTYKGSFIVQADESADMVQKMTFTATGNNTCVWGSKKTAYSKIDDLPDITSSSQLVYNENSVMGTGKAVRLSDTDLLSGVSYVIRNKNSGLPIDLADGSTQDGANVHQWEDIGGSAQEWRITAQDDGYCVIQSMNDEGKCIAVSENSADDGINVELQTYTGADNQLWKLVQDGAFYGIVSKCSADKAGLDVFEWSTESGGNINQWEYWGGACQQWSITPVYPTVNNGYYTLKNINSGLFVADDNGNIVQSKEQAWNITKLDDGYYTIADQNGQLLTVENGSADDGANIYLDTAKNDNSQKFRLYTNGDGSYTILTAVSDGKSAADIYGISLDDGANICQWNYWGGDGQKFVIEPADVSATEPPFSITGDVNADKMLNIADIVMLQKWLVNAVEIKDLSVADINNDGKINIFDAVLLKRQIL